MTRPFRLAITIGTIAALGLGPRVASAQQQCPATSSADLPLKYAGGRTVAAITPCDLMTRLYVFADDSMRGRQLGTDDNLRATAYIANEVRRLGLKPAGQHGGYFQYVPLFSRALDSASTVSVDGRIFRAGVDFVVNAVGQVEDLGEMQVVFGGTAMDTLNLLTPEQTRGALVLLRSGSPATPTLTQSAGFKAYQQSLVGATIVTIAGDKLSDAAIRSALAPTGPTAVRLATAVAANRPSPLSGLVVTRALAEAMLGSPLQGGTKGMRGHAVTFKIRFVDTPRPLGRNVIALIPGTDSKRRGEVLVLGSHSDHIGLAARPVDHDSLKAYNAFARPQGADAAPKTLSPDEWKQVNGTLDSLHKLHGGSRPDSIDNGADAGSGAISLLEIAEAFAKGKTKPKRSILFVWHTGQERGMWGSQYFTDNPTVVRDSIVAEIDLDMVGRGAPADVTGHAADGAVLHGGDKYVQLLGARRLSAELGQLVENVNQDQRYGFALDSSLDAAAHPQNAYCRNDQAMYATWGIPALLFTTGSHADSHMVTDEPQYIRYRHLALLDQLVFDLAVRIADLDHAVRVDRPRPTDSRVACHQ